MMVPVVQGTSLIRLLVTITANTEPIPKTGPKNAPAIGPKKSKRVKETFDPASLLKGIWSEINPSVVNKAKKNNFFCTVVIKVRFDAFYESKII